MTFLNALLAFGATAFLVPLLIHLLHRSKFQVVEWGAMHFLTSSVKVNSRRFQWRHLLLLLLRCLLPVLLAIAMARPLMQSWMTAAPDQPVDLAVIIDDSTSMFATDNAKGPIAEKTRFGMACQKANDMIDKLPRGSNAVIVFGGTSPTTIEAATISELKEALLKTAFRTNPSGPFDLSASVQLATQWLAKSSSLRRQIVVLTDFQTGDWEEGNADSLRRVQDLLASQSVAPELQMVSVLPVPYVKPSNVCLAAMDYSPALVANGQTVTITVTIRNQSSDAIDRVPITFFANEDEIQQQSISVPGNSSIQVRCLWNSPERDRKKANDVLFRAEVKHNDAIEYDNAIRTRVQLVEPIEVLLVDGDRRNESFRSESDYLRLALSPFALMQGSQGDLFVSRSIQPHELNEAAIEKADVLALCNVSDVSEQQQSWIRKRVELGMGFVVFMGDRVRVEQYNSWKPLSNAGLRIGELSARRKLGDSERGDGKGTAEAVSEGAGVRLKTSDAAFKPVAELSKLTQSALASIPFEFVSPIKISEVAASTRMAFETGEPWIVESPVGRGTMIWVMTACDDGDSVLPTRPVYLPLVQRLFQYVSNRRADDTRVAPGEMERRLLNGDATAIESVNNVDVVRPDQQLVPAPLVASVEASKGQKVLEFADTRLLGPYTFRFLESDYAFVVSNQPVGRDVNAGTGQDTESELEVLGRDAIETRAKLLGAKFYDMSSVNSMEVGTLLSGRELWTWVWTILLICFLAEIALEQQMSPRTKWTSRRSTASDIVDNRVGGNR